MTLIISNVLRDKDRNSTVIYSELSATGITIFVSSLQSSGDIYGSLLRRPYVVSHKSCPGNPSVTIGGFHLNYI